MKEVAISLPIPEYERWQAGAERLGTTPEALIADALERLAHELAEQRPAPPPER